MFNRIWSRFFRKESAKERRIADLQNMDDIEFDNDEDRTEMIDTLAYHQPTKQSVAEKARRLAEGASA